MRKKEKKRRKKKSLFHVILFFLLKLAAIAGIIYLLLTYVLAVKRLTGNNMFPALKDGDLCIFYKLDPYHTQDVVLYKDSNGEERTGRIIAIHEQEIDFPEAGGFLVNGFQPAEEILYKTYKSEDGKVKYPLVISDGEYFIMNDYRSDTKDSREYGVIKEEDLLGKAIFILRRREF